MKAVCAVSGGMDSATCLWNCVGKYGSENVLGVSVFYGQRHEIELTKAREECEKLNVKHIEANLTSVFQFNKNVSALLNGSKEEIVQGKTYAELMDEKIARGEAPISDEYIPNRNSIIANILAAIGMQFFKNEEITIVMGVHSDDNLIREGSDISAYPDCSPEWSAAVSKELEIGTAGLVRLETPLVYKTKTGVAQFGTENGMTKEDFNHTWSCYKGGDKQCGKCPTCIDRIRALINVGIYRDVKDLTDNYQLTEDEAEKLLNPDK